MAQEYTVEQLNYGRRVHDFMRWDFWAFGISGFLLILSVVIIGVKGFNWGLDFTGGTVIEISLEKPADLDMMRSALEKAGFQDPLVQNLVAAVTSWCACHLPKGKPVVRCWVARSLRSLTKQPARMPV